MDAQTGGTKMLPVCVSTGARHPSFSYGASAYRGAVSLTLRRELRPLALLSEIMRHENLHGYLKFLGPWRVAAIRALSD